MPRFTLVSAVYNVARYLPDFLASLDEQELDHELVEIIFVNDGSTDESREVLARWAEQTDYDARILDQVNAGQGAARNAGLAEARGEWVSFPDPDDILEPQFLAELDKYIGTNDDIAVAAGHPIDFFERTGELRDSHPLRFRFAGGTQVRDLERFPRNVLLSVNATFFDTRDLQNSGIEFDPNIRPTFEDAHFVSRYLLGSPSRRVLFVDEARYRYRRRADLTSSLQISTSDPRRYTTVLRYGPLDLLRRAAEKGPVPIWLQNVVLYDLFWIFRHAESLAPQTGALPEEVADEFLELMGQIRTYLSDQVIRAFDVIRVSNSQREAVLHGFVKDSWHWDFVVADRLDEKRKLVRFRYRFTGEQPAENFEFRGLPAEPMFTKTRTFKVLGKPVLYERLIWITARGTLGVGLDGLPVPIRFDEPASERFSVRPARLAQRWGKKDSVKNSSRSRSAKKSRKLRGSGRLRARILDRRFQASWVFMDRPGQADDNAEHLYKYVRKNHTDINAWFVVEKNSKDWRRLRAEGVDRLVAYGSREWKELCIRASVLLSSHADVSIIAPFVLPDGRKPRWDTIFLQHGVTQGDISAWMNSKRFDLMITATEPEYRSIVGDGSSYVLTQKEVALTGFPRFDGLLEKEASSDSAREWITIMPTWRKDLRESLTKLSTLTERRELFASSEYARQWSAFLKSEKLLAVAKENALGIRFMPHPELQPYIDCFDIPAHVTSVSYADMGVQDALIESDVVITDYSSVVFDAAFIDRSVLYFQFDHQTLFAGNHIALPGYFDYRRDGFGPVGTSVGEALDRLDALLDGDDSARERYAERRSSTFTLPRHGNCQRVMKAVLRTRRPVSPQAGTTLQPPLVAPSTRFLE